MTGEQLLAAVTGTIKADYPMLRCFHSGGSLRDSMPGWPDLAIAGPGGFLTAECKGPDEELSPDQVAWKWSLQGAGVQWRLYRESAWPITIRADLDRLAGL